MQLTGRVALVTGASRGLGLALARELVRRGCRVAVCARDPEELERARADLARDGGDVLAVPCDVSDREQVEALVARVVDEYGSLDVLVTNAGVIQVGPLATMRVEDFEDALGVMFWGVALPTLAALPHLRRARGRIATITSIGGKVAAPHLLPYAAAKFAAVGFSEGLAAELAREGVRVTTVVPGLMRTGSPLNAFVKGDAAREFSWFTVADSIPGLSMEAGRAARRIVTAVQRGRTEVVLTAPAKLAVRVHGLMPATTVRVLGLANRVLPRAGGAGQRAVRGETAAPAVRSPLFRWLTAPTRRAAEQLHQRPGPLAAPPAVRSAGAPSGRRPGPPGP
ncbi:SDR family NAD(P)-dependent oxidoreductase [Geodermatophilus sp. SYSU D00815]